MSGTSRRNLELHFVLQTGAQNMIYFFHNKIFMLLCIEDGWWNHFLIYLITEGGAFCYSLFVVYILVLMLKLVFRPYDLGSDPPLTGIALLAQPELEMSGQHILKAARLSFTKENGCLILIMTGLVVAENFVEKEFQCICRFDYRIVFFSFYLGIPAFIVFTVTFCVVCELERQRANKEAEKQERAGQAQNQKCNNCLVILWCAIPSFFWVLLFFCDGRYVACMATTLKGEYADNTAPPPWEWCNKNRTLTADEKEAETAYIWSKITGFTLLFLFSVIILVCEYRRKCKAFSEQVEAVHGTAGTAKDSRRPKTSINDEVELEESSNLHM